MNAEGRLIWWLFMKKLTQAVYWIKIYNFDNFLKKPLPSLYSSVRNIWIHLCRSLTLTLQFLGLKTQIESGGGRVTK